MNEHSEYNTTHSIGKLTVMKILSETNFADNHAFIIIKNYYSVAFRRSVVFYKYSRVSATNQTD